MSGEPVPIRKRLFAHFLRIIRILNVVLLLSCVASSVMLCVATASSTLTVLQKFLMFVSQIGYIAIDVVLLLGVVEPGWFIRRVYVLHFWVPKGVGNVWVGVQLLNSSAQLEAAVRGMNLSVNLKALVVAIDVVGWVLASIGLLYVVMSLLCLRNTAEENSPLEDRMLPHEKDEKNSEKEKAAAGVSPTHPHGSDDAAVAGNFAAAFGVDVGEARRFYGGKDGRGAAAALLKKKIDDAVAAARRADALKESGKPPPDAPPRGRADSSTKAVTPPPKAAAAAAGPSKPSAKEEEDDPELAQYYASMGGRT